MEICAISNQIQKWLIFIFFQWWAKLNRSKMTKSLSSKRFFSSSFAGFFIKKHSFLNWRRKTIHSLDISIGSDLLQFPDCKVSNVVIFQSKSSMENTNWSGNNEILLTNILIGCENECEMKHMFIFNRWCNRTFLMRKLAHFFRID